MKNEVCTIIGIVGGAIATAFGGWDTALAALVTFMAIDYITGLMVAGIFHTSPKTESGALESLPQRRDAAGGAGSLPAGQGDGFQLHPGCCHHRLYGERGNLDH